MRIIPKLISSFIVIFLSILFSFSPVFAYLFNSENNRKLVSSPPTAININNFPIQNISGRSQILPLIGSDSDGSIISFKILSLPNNAHGILYLNNVAVSVNQDLNPVQAKQLQFEVKSTFTGTASFTYTVTDNDGLSDNSAGIFSIPVTNSGTILVCSGGGLGNNILGAEGTFSSPFITANATSNCINNNSTIASPLQNLGNAKPGLTSYTYASTSGGLGPEGTYSFLKTLGTMATRNCIKTDWVASDHTGDGGYAMIVNGSPNSATFGKTFYNASSIAVCPNTLYEFSAYVINVLPGDHSAALPGTEPNISFYINNQLVSTSGAIPYSNDSTSFEPGWVKVGGLWYSGPNTSVDLRIDNATFVASGNDLGLDDISMAICGPEITYPDISLTPKFCSYGVLPLKANIVASINTYASYIFQNSIDGGLTWNDMGSPATGSPVYNTLTGSYEYQAIYGDIPIDPSMNGYRYRLKVATDASNLAGTTCNISADKIITVSAFEKPLAGADITGCNSSSTAKLKVAGSGETWASVAGNPAAATIDQSGNISGMVTNGFYRFQLINSSGCTDTVSVTRDEVSSAGADVKICSPQSTYKFSDAGLGYKWIKFAGNPADASIDSLTGEVTGMSADGIYRFMLKSDYGGCTDEVSITRSTLTLISNQTNVNCFGESTGTINLTITGGTAPYTYNWNSGQSSKDLNGLSAGTYIVSVVDSVGCTATDTILISQPLAFLTLSSTQTNVNCFGESTGSIDLSISGGTAPYSYNWSSGQVTEDLTGLAGGSYTVTVTDSKGCTATETILITQPAAILALSSTQTNVNCFGESTGAINLTVSGGTAPYSYSWSSGQATEDLSGLAAGSYTVTVTDSKGCTAAETILITQPAAILAISSTQTNINCFGESTGAINLTITGGTAPYSYNWSSGQATEDLSGIKAGNYLVTVTDANSCTNKLEILITQPELMSVSLKVKNASCKNTSDGSITANIKGGKAPYTLIWNENKALNYSEIKNVKPGKYELLITDSNGCSLKAETEILYGDCSPIARDDSFKTEQQVPFTGDVSPNDSDPNNEKLTFLKLSEPGNGKIVFNQDGKFSFQPDSGFNGQTNFTYQICNISGNCKTANVQITVSPVSLVSLNPEISSVKEGDKVSITARLRQTFPEDVFVTLEYSGKAEKEKDYLLLDNYQGLKIPKGSLSTTDKITIAVINDAFEEGVEDIKIKIKTVSNAAVKIGNGALVTINDVYPPPPITDVPGVEPVNRDIEIDPLLSPNGDGLGNEYFTIRNIEEYPDNEVIIFNRWGNELFYIKAYNSSDRTFKGYANKGLLVNSEAPLTDGVYFYIVNTFKTNDGVRTKNINRGYLILKR